LALKNLTHKHRRKANDEIEVRSWERCPQTADREID